MAEKTKDAEKSMRVDIRHGRTHKWEVRTTIGQCLFSTDFFNKAQLFVLDNGHLLRQGTTEDSALPAWTEKSDREGERRAEMRMENYNGGFQG